MSWNTSVVTNAGVGLLNESLAGHTLTIERAAGGAGTLGEEALKAATDVADPKQTFHLLGIEDVEEGKRVGVQITNQGVKTSYILHQIGVKARLEFQGPDELTLLFVLQDDRGVEIPAETENPDFLFEIYGILTISNNANISVRVDAGVVATVAYVDNTKADRTLSNLSNYQKALHNIGGRPNRNLLVNSHFTIWQRCPEGTFTGVPSNRFLADRFTVTSSNGSAQNTIERAEGGGIKLAAGPSCVLRYKMENTERLNGRTFTLSTLASNGFFTKTITCSGLTGTMDILNQFASTNLFWLTLGRTIYAMKLEEGPTQTLAYQDEAGTWQLFETPDDREELARCQFYFNRYNFVSGGLMGWGYAINAAEMGVLVYLGKMRINPTVSVSDISQLKISKTALADGVSPSGVVAASLDHLGLLNLSLRGNFTAGDLYRVGLTGGYIDFSAEL